MNEHHPVVKTKDKALEIFRRPVMFGWAVIGYLTFCAGLGLVVNVAFDAQAEQDAAAAQNQDEEIYEAQFRAYEVALIDYGDCLNGIQARADHRFQWTDFYAELKAELGDDEATAEFINRLVLKLDENLPPTDPTTCRQPGPPPVPPEGTDAQPLPTFPSQTED